MSLKIPHLLKLVKENLWILKVKNSIQLKHLWNMGKWLEQTFFLLPFLNRYNGWAPWSSTIFFKALLFDVVQDIATHSTLFTNKILKNTKIQVILKLKKLGGRSSK